MYLIAIGLIFLFFSFTIDIFGPVIDLLPDLVGCALIAYNAWKLQGKSYSLTRTVWLAAVLGVYVTVVHLVAPTGLIALFLSALEVGGTVWLLKLLVSGVAELEEAEKRPLRQGALELWRMPLTVAYIGIFACNVALMFIPGIGFFSLLVVIVWYVIAIIFTVCFFRTAANYRKTDGGDGKDGKKLIRGPLPPHNR